MEIDIVDAGTNSPRHAFVRFRSRSRGGSGAYRGHEPADGGAEHVDAGSTDSGEVWQVNPFDRAALFVGDPGNAQPAAIAASLGATNVGQIVTWSLPTNIVDGNSVYLGLRPLVSDGAHYLNLNAAVTDAPRLLVACP